MSKPPLEYQNATGGENPTPPVRFQTIVSGWLLGLALLCGLAALVWTQRRGELFGAAISLAATAVIVHLPYRRL